MRDVSFAVHGPGVSLESSCSLWPFCPYLRHGLLEEKKKKMREEPDASCHSASCIHLKIIGEAPFHSRRAAHKRVIAYSKTAQVCRFNFSTQSLWGVVSPTARKNLEKFSLTQNSVMSCESLLHVKRFISNICQEVHTHTHLSVDDWHMRYIM